MNKLKIQILVDNPNSWILPYAAELLVKLVKYGHEVTLLHKHNEVASGEILILLSCERIYKSLVLNKYNLVVHESDLPKGKGWSPVTWQVLEGKNKIPVTLFEATEDVDAGSIYAKEYIILDGTELLAEIKHKQGLATQKLILDFVKNYPNIMGEQQVGEESYYPRRKPKDSQLDVDKNIAEQFDLLRVCDNDRYPAHFTYRKQKYILKIYKENDQ